MANAKRSFVDLASEQATTDTILESVQIGDNLKEDHTISSGPTCPALQLCSQSIRVQI